MRLLVANVAHDLKTVNVWNLSICFLLNTLSLSFAAFNLLYDRRGHDPPTS